MQSETEFVRGRNGIIYRGRGNFVLTVKSSITTAKQLAQTYLEANNPTGWFEELYTLANWDETAIPWADLTVNPNLSAWLQREQVRGEGKKALVIGCGLGDDAEALSQLGFEVVAFDIAPTAITWCGKRFPESQVTYSVVDLFEATESWQGYFDFVFESYTLQALPAELRAKAITIIPQWVKLGGKLLVICRGRDKYEPEGVIPWPITREELTVLQQYGLTEVSFEDYLDEENPPEDNSPVRRFRVCYSSVRKVG